MKTERQRQHLSDVVILSLNRALLVEMAFPCVWFDSDGSVPFTASVIMRFQFSCKSPRSNCCSAPVASGVSTPDFIW